MMPPGSTAAALRNQAGRIGRSEREKGGTPVKADQGRIAQFFLGGFCACCCLLAGLAAAIVGVVRSICFSIWWRMQTGARGR
jgi:hypothetical protein